MLQKFETKCIVNSENVEVEKKFRNKIEKKQELTGGYQEVSGMCCLRRTKTQT